MHTTLKDIADEVGTSITTVSKVLNGKEIRVSEDKRQEILATAERLKYLPNISGVNLRKGCTDLIAVIVGDLLYPYYAKLLKEISDLISARGKSVIVCDIDNNEDMELRHYQRLKSGYVDGVIIAPPPFNRSAKNIQRGEAILGKINLPVVMLFGDGGKLYPNYTTVGTNSLKCGYVATRHLIDLGHRRIAYLSETRGDGFINPRLEGYIMALEEAGIPYRPELVAAGYTRYAGGRAAFRALENKDMTAVVCSGDMLAIGFSNEAIASGWRIPGDCSVVGMDNIMATEQNMPQITTVSQNVGELARLAVGELFRDLEERRQVRRPEVRHIQIEPELVVRSSTAPPPPERQGGER